MERDKKNLQKWTFALTPLRIRLNSAQAPRGLFLPKLLLLPEAAMRSVSITQWRSHEVNKNKGRTGGSNSKKSMEKTASKILAVLAGRGEV